MVKKVGLCALVLLLLGCSLARVGATDVDITVVSDEPVDLSIDASSVGGLGITLNGVNVLGELSNVAGGLNEMYFRIVDLRTRVALLQNATGSELGALYSRDNYLAGVVGFMGNSTLAARLRVGNLTVVEELELLQAELRGLNDSLPLLRAEVYAGLNSLNEKVDVNDAGLLSLLGIVDSRVSSLASELGGLKAQVEALSGSMDARFTQRDVTVGAQGERIAALERSVDNLQTQNLILYLVVVLVVFVYWYSRRRVPLRLQS